jgi:tRNA pseudouridine38-40 synthase
VERKRAKRARSEAKLSEGGRPRPPAAVAARASLRRLLLRLEYDGSEFAGWQLQPDARTVQGTLEQHLRQVTGEQVRVTGASRTDAGVHALDQVAHFDAETRLSSAELERALNAVLPPDLSVRAAREAAPGFHAQRDALSKRYEYRLLVGRRPSPLRRRVVWAVRGPLDVEAMAAAASALKGLHDFAAFRGSPGGAPPRQETRRVLDRLDLVPAGDELRIVAEARGFLRYMVRNLVGTLVAIGRGRLSADALAEIEASRDRSQAGPTAPPQGLCLVRVRVAGDPAEEAEEGPSDGGSGAVA